MRLVLPSGSAQFTNRRNTRMRFVHSSFGPQTAARGGKQHAFTTIILVFPKCFEVFTQDREIDPVFESSAEAVQGGFRVKCLPAALKQLLFYGSPI